VRPALTSVNRPEPARNRYGHGFAVAPARAIVYPSNESQFHLEGWSWSDRSPYSPDQVPLATHAQGPGGEVTPGAEGDAGSSATRPARRSGGG